jgi:FkbM family methyltransferase
MKFYGQSIATGGGSVDPLDKIIYDRYFTGKTTGHAIECGANDGLFLSTCKVFEDMGWDATNIEASKENYDKLVKNRPNSLNLFYALSSVSGDTISVLNYAHENGGMNHIESVRPHAQVANEAGRKTIVTTIRYDDLISKPVDLFVLDVEGNEYNVLVGMRNTRYWPDVLCVEYVHCPGIDEAILSLPQKYIVDYKDGLNMILVKK